MIRSAFGGLLFVVAVLLQAVNIGVFTRMMDEVNAVSAENDRIPLIGPSWYRGIVIKRHRQYFPASSARRKLYALWAVTTMAFMAAIACVVTFK